MLRRAARTRLTATIAAIGSLAACGALVSGLLIGCGGSDNGGELLVLGAASLSMALTEYAESFAAETGATVRTSFAGSDQLATQIRQGAPADVFASADAELPAALHNEGLVGKPRVFATAKLVIAVPAESAIAGLSDLAESGVKLVLGDESVPVGAYTRAVLAELPVAEREGILANVRSAEPDVKSVVAKLAQGVADAGIVYNTDVASDSDLAAAGTKLRAIPLPDRLQPGIAFAVASVTDGDRPAPAAEEFIDGLVAGEGAEALRRAGFLPPP